MLVPRRPLARSLILGACLSNGWLATRAEQPPLRVQTLSGERSSGSIRIGEIPGTPQQVDDPIGRKAAPVGEGVVGGSRKYLEMLTRNADVPVVPAAEARYKGQPGIPSEAPGPPTGEASRPRGTDVPLDVRARRAVERAIPYVESEGTAWIRERQCLACHYAGYMLWSLRDADLRGFAIDKGKLAESSRWALARPSMQSSGTEGAAQIIIARDRSDRSPDTTRRVDALRDLIVKNQRTDGSWHPGGQLPSQKRPLSETTQVSTMLCVLALDSLDGSDEVGIKARDRALAWLKDTPPIGNRPAVSSEWYAMRLLIEQKFGDPKQAEAIRDQVLSAQRPDGGWGWLRADASDAFGTGVSLYALGETRLAHSHPAIQNAWKFLAETQTDDGSWIVNGTKNETKGGPHALSSYWGTTWAVLGLSHSLPLRSSE